MAKKKKSRKEEAEVHDDLAGFNIKIDAFGQMQTNTSADKLNTFLDGKMPVKKNTEEEWTFRIYHLTYQSLLQAFCK